MGPLSILSRVGEDNWDIECRYNVRGLKRPLTAINREVDEKRMGDSPGCHSVIELNDHRGVEKQARDHERLQGVPLHKPYGISELGKGGKIRHVVKGLVVQLFVTAIRISNSGATMEDRSSDKRSKGQIQREVSSRPLNKWGLRLLGPRIG